MFYSFQVVADNLSDSNQLFDWAEINYSQFFNPSGKETFQYKDYLVRYYEGTDSYAGTKQEDVYVYGKVFNGLLHVGKIGDFIKSGGSNDFSAIDTSQPLMKQIQQIFSNLKPNSHFYDVKIKLISHPSTFVGTWTMWSDFRAAKSTLNADGSCGVESFHYKEGETVNHDCLQWFHVTLEKDNTSFLLFVHKNYTSLVNYEWNDDNNIYFHYYRGKGHLATRASSTPYAKNFKDRFFLGNWVESDTSYTIAYWGFDADNQFFIKTYMAEDNQLAVDGVGTWSLDKKQLTLTVPLNNIQATDKAQELNILKRNIPPKESTLDYYAGIERLRLNRDFERLSEPLMISTDPFIGKFQAHSTYNSSNAISLNIFHKSSDNYNVDIFWNNTTFFNNNAVQKDGLLHVTTELGILVFQPVINGIKKINRLENGKFNFPERILRTSQDPTPIPSNLVGNWVQSDHYSIPEKFRYFTFLENGRFFHTNRALGVNIGREGTYRKENDRIYLKPRCGGKEVIDTFRLNEAHYSPESYGTTAFVKIKNSSALSSVWYALQQYEETYKKREVGLIPAPAKEGKFLFATEKSYRNPGIINMHFYNNGTMFTSYPGSSGIIHNDYYIEANQGVEKIILLKSSTNPITTSDSKSLALYDGRRTICSDDSFELGLD